MNVDDITPWLFFIVVGLVGGLVLFVRGLVAYRRDRLISSVATSSLDGIAAGEVRVSGVIEPIEQTLISPLQSKPCVWYRARVETTGKNSRVLMNEEKSQEFRIRNETGEIRVVPRGARWEIGTVYDERTSLLGSEPAGLKRRSGAGYASWVDRDPEKMSEIEREAAAQALLQVQRPGANEPTDDWADDVGGMGAYFSNQGGRRYREARLEPGQTVTILGQAWPWGEVHEVLLAWNPSDNVETDIAGDIAYARQAGTLAASPEEAWGNAAIPGFGIGMPTAQPELDPDVQAPDIPADDVHQEALEKYDIPDEELVLSRGLKGGLAIYAGTPQAATQHHDFAFMVGIIGAVMAVICALALGAIITATL
ncbi:MAG: hypothetical protein U9O18_09515 [Chloroflexota bacterium]|nr:hypothetical protein [Chloroflexota bacterium]